MKQIRSLSEMRGAAALAVTACHISCFNHPFIIGNSEFPVLLFVMLSAFLCMYTSETKRTFSFQLKLLKICPLYYLVTVFTFLLATIKPSFFNTTTPTPVNLIKSIFFIPYINPNGLVRPILDVGWTLSAEILLFLIFAISAQLCFRYRGFITGIFMFALYIIGFLFVPKHPIFVLYSRTLLAAIAGIFLYALWCRTPQNTASPNKCSSVFGIIPFIMLWGAMSICGSFSLNDFTRVLLVFLIGFVFLLKPEVPLFSRLFCFIGSISYPLYLTHQFVVKGFDRLIHPLRTLNPLNAVLGCICILIAIVIAYIISRFIEPHLRIGKLTRKTLSN